MKRKINILILVVLFSLSATIEGATQELLLKDRQLLVTMGNSITELGEEADGYVSIMRKVLQTLYPEQTVYIVNVGISGHKATDMSERLERDVLQYRPQWVTISVGVNDVWHDFLRAQLQRSDLSGVPLPLFRQKVIDMVQRSQAAGIQVALFTTTIIKEDLSSAENRKLIDYNQTIRKIARDHKTLLVDMDQAFRQALLLYQKPGMADRGVLTYDGVHMLPSGNWLMAKTALIAFGVPSARIDAIKPRIEALIAEEKKSLATSLARYAEVNFEVGLPREGERRVVFFGSSSVDGWNLAQDFPMIPFLNRGIGGETSRQMVFRFQPDVIKLKPHAVIIFLGSCNDFWPDKQMLPAETKSNLIKMARLAKRNGIQLAVGAISPVNDYLPGKDFIASHPVGEVQALNNWIKKFCQENGYYFVDFYSAVADSNGKLTSEFTEDGMHCNALGYAQWKPVVIQALKDLGAWKE
ncbi:MAG: GDSL-type esterase/lipase family protein [candidate division KSB1 bacterium]|nr:GDSL-type esterase/lipase family protein [candidate division KSB1 bacterium]